MSDGSSALQIRDNDFRVRRTLRVRSNGAPVTLLNDLCYAEGFVYANVWGQSYICEIDFLSGRVTRILDCSHLVSLAAPRDPNALLNGIAYNPEAGTLFVTGKFWPRLFEIECPS
jgi:glutamine cyclotransferase